MKNFKISPAILIILVLLLSVNTFCQTYGKVFSKSEADRLYGVVNSSVKLQVSELQDMLNKTNSVLMFRVKDGKLIVLADGRNQVYPGYFPVASEDEFRVYSKSVITELINKGNTGIAIVELRNNLLTITIGDYTLEQGVICPPFCQ